MTSGMVGSTGRATHRRLVGQVQLRPFSARNALRLTGIHGLVLIVLPHSGLSIFDAPLAGDAGYWLRHCGVLFAVLTVVFWSAATWPSSMMQRPVMWAAGILTVALAVIGVLGVLDGTVNSLFGIVVGVELVLAIWLGWLLATDGI